MLIIFLKKKLKKGILCGIVVNEVEGFVAENQTETDIIAFLQKGTFLK